MYGFINFNIFNLLTLFFNYKCPGLNHPVDNPFEKTTTMEHEDNVIRIVFLDVRPEPGHVRWCDSIKQVAAFHYLLEVAPDICRGIRRQSVCIYRRFGRDDGKTDAPVRCRHLFMQQIKIFFELLHCCGICSYWAERYKRREMPE